MVVDQDDGGSEMATIILIRHLARLNERPFCL